MKGIMANEAEIDIVGTTEGSFTEDKIVSKVTREEGETKEEICTAPITHDDVELKGKHRWPIHVQQMSLEIQHAYGIVKDIASVSHRSINWPFVDGVDSQVDNMTDYEEVIKSPMWLKKILEHAEAGKYNSISEVIGQVRLMLENCYRYHGPDHSFTKKGLQLEQLMEQKLSLLPRELRDKTAIEVTPGDTVQEDDSSRRRSLRHNISYNSIILNKVRHEKAERDRTLRKRNSEVKKAEKEGKEKEVEEWEEKLTEGPVLTQMKAMWELPQIGHFLFLCQTVLNTPEVPQYELERILIMPRQSLLLAKIMTSLLSNRNQRSKLDRLPPMPYKIWHHKLVTKVQAWYKVFNAKEQNPNLVFELLGIEPSFFKVLGLANPLDEKPFHGLTFHQRVWVLKGLCDHILHRYKAIQDIINDQQIEDLREYMLGTDSENNSYLHFPQFCGQDLRIYRRSKWIAPKLPQPELNSSKRGRKAGAKKRERKSWKKKKSRSGRILRSKRSYETSSEDEPIVNGESKEEVETEEFEDVSIEPCIDRFELIVDSVESLKELVAKFEAKTTLEPKNKRTKSMQHEPETNNEAELIQNLKNLHAELEPWDTKLQQAMRRTRQRLKKEYEEFMLNGVLKQEQNHELIWKSDSEDEERSIPDSGESVHERSNQSSDYEPAEDRRRSKRSAVKKKTLQIALKEAERKARQDRVEKRQSLQEKIAVQKELHDEEDYDEDDEDEDEEVVEYTDVSSRGRVRKIRTVRAKAEVMPKLKAIEMEKPANGNVGLLRNYSRQNTKVQAERHLAWESLRQILVQPSHKRDEVVSLDTNKPSDAQTDSAPAAQNPLTAPLQKPTIISRNRISNQNSSATRQTLYIVSRSKSSMESPPTTPVCKIHQVRNEFVPTRVTQPPVPSNIVPRVTVKPRTSLPLRNVQTSPPLVLQLGHHTYSKLLPERNTLNVTPEIEQTSDEVAVENSTISVPQPAPSPSSPAKEATLEQHSGSCSTTDSSVQDPESTPSLVDTAPSSAEGTSTVNLTVVCIEDNATHTKQLGVIMPDGSVMLLDNLVAATNNGTGEAGTITLQLPSAD